MRLVIGGAFQGKKDYVKNTFHLEDGEMQDGASASYEDIFSCPCLYHFHQWDPERVRRKLGSGRPGNTAPGKKSPYHPDLQ